MKLSLSKLLPTLACISIFGQFMPTASAQGTAFTYQGRLNSAGAAANGSYDLAFTLYATNTAGVSIAGPVTNLAVAVSNGLFTTVADFGNAFTGASNWLELAVSTNGANRFATLAPRQQVTPAPYAITAEGLSFNAVLDVNGLVIQPATSGAPNVIAGASFNDVPAGVVGAAIGGGGAINYYGGAYSNSVTGDFGTVGGGRQNTADASATVGGGQYNSASATAATVAGGDSNTASGGYSTVAGGDNNLASGPFSFAAGSGAQAVTEGAFVWADASGPQSFASTGVNQFLIRAGGGVGIGTNQPGAALDVAGDIHAAGTVRANVFIGGYSGNTVSNGIVGGFIGGGGYSSYANAVGGNYSSVVGGSSNLASGSISVVAGGSGNIASGTGAGVIGGSGNTASGTFATAGGQNTTASGDESVAMGLQNTASGFAAVTIGYLNNASGQASTALGTTTTASGDYSTALGGGCTASGNYSTAIGNGSVAGGAYSVAMGDLAKATNNASLVWADGTAPTASTNAYSVTMRASGGYRFFTGTTAVGVSLAPNATAWATISDQNAKKNFAAVDGQDILAKLAGVPVEKWNYKWETDNDVPHIGPMAQAFKAAFYPGRDDKSITTLEFDGVELAAIQGLNQKVEEKDARLCEQAAEISDLKSRLAKLEQLVNAKLGETK